MKSLHVFGALLLTMGLLNLTACAAKPERESTGEYLDDTVLTTRVKAAIFADKSLSVAEINVETFKGVVQLSGFVGSTAEINKAMQLARSISGVVSVKNDMRVK